jgi:hypothetical protein
VEEEEEEEDYNLMAFTGFSTSESRLMDGSQPLFSDSSLLGFCKLSHSVNKSGGDDPSYLRANVSNDTVAFAFRGIFDPPDFQATASKFGDSPLEWMKDGNNQSASVHQGALKQFLHLWNTSRLQEEVFTILVSFYQILCIFYTVRC